MTDIATATLEEPEVDVGGIVNDSEVELGRLGALSADLTSFAAEIESNKTVDRSTAISIECICSGTIDTDRFPLASFTEAPSKTNLQPTLEGIDEKLKSITSGILESIVEFLRRIGKFFIELWNRIFSRERQQEELRAKIKEVQKSTDFVMKNAPVELQSQIVAAVNDAQDVLDVELAPQVQRINRDLLHSIIAKDHTHRAVVALGHSFIDYMSTIIERVILIQAEVRVVAAHPDTTTIAIGKLRNETLEVRYNNAALNTELQSLRLLRTHDVDSLEIALGITGLKEKVEELYSERSLKAPTIQTILKSDARTSFIKNPENIGPTYSKLSSAVDKLATVAPKGIDSIMHLAILKLSALIRKEYHAAANFLTIANQYATVATEVIELDLHIATKINEEARRARRGKPA
jgi:hypothetical protein